MDASWNVTREGEPISVPSDTVAFEMWHVAIGVNARGPWPWLATSHNGALAFRSEACIGLVRRSELVAVAKDLGRAAKITEPGGRQRSTVDRFRQVADSQWARCHRKQRGDEIIDATDALVSLPSAP
ncbi:unnamed protein product, partial [Iphiclides podalirius]